MHFISEIKQYYSHIGFLLIALILGMRHGLDLDHLAMIDAITRKLPPQSKLSRLVGLLFSLGHGVVVISFCVILSFFIKKLAIPNYLYSFMSLLSILFLILFGFLNLYSLIKINSTHLKTLLLQTLIFKKIKILNTSPISIMVVGGVFAISFDTVSQVALFSMNTTSLFNIFFSILLGVLFMFGMMLTDGINGCIVSFLIKKANQLSLTLSRIITLSVGLFSTTIGISEIIHFLC